ncbi:MAG: hypothetical protein RJA07_781 [Bacteroidota bacterium]|jgi:hypothetical protein
MKKIISSTIFLLILSGLFSFQQSQSIDYGLTRVNKTNNKLVFFWNEPSNEYEVVFSFANLIPNINCLSPAKQIDVSLKNANIEAANQGKFYDAIIIGKSTNRDIAIIFKDKSKDNSIARVKRDEGKYVFIECEPLANYDVVYKSDVSGIGQQILLGTCPSMQEKIDKLLKRATKNNKEFDGVIYGSTKNDLAIQFK